MCGYAAGGGEEGGLYVALACVGREGGCDSDEEEGMDNDSVVELNGSATPGWDRGANVAVVLIMYYAFLIMH